MARPRKAIAAKSAAAKSPKNAPVIWPDKDGPPKRPRGRPRKVLSEPEDIQAQGEALAKSSSEVRAGVNATWLANAFRMDIVACRNRLAGLAPIGLGERNAPIYDFVNACTYLAAPHPDQFARYMRTLRTQDMPTQLQEAYWGALRRKQLWERDAGELWKTDDVLEVFAETFKTIKSRMQLWVDNLDSKGELSEEHRARLTAEVDGLANDIYASLIDMPKKRRTVSSALDPAVISNQEPADFESEDSDEDLIG